MAGKKILVFNGSPQKEQSGTFILTKAFVKGLENVLDCETEYITVSNLNVHPCKGCLSCWSRSDASCVIKNDDVDAVRQKIEDADIVILSAPLYFFSLPGETKVLLDRLLVMLNPYRGQSAGPETQPFHSFRKLDPNKKFMFISSCAWNETDRIYDAVFKQLDLILGVGRYSRLEFTQMRAVHFAGKRRLAMVQKDFCAAGEEFAKTGVVSQDTFQKLAKPVYSESVYQSILESFWSNGGPASSGSAE